MIELERPQRWQQPPWGMSQVRSLTMDNSKLCRSCNQSLPLSLFGKDAKFKDGLRSVCKDCNNAKATTYYLANKDTIAIKASLRFQKQMSENPEDYRKASAARQARFRANNPERSKVSYSRWLTNNPGANYQATKKWRAKNPDAVLAANERRRALKANAPTFIVTAKDVQKLLGQPCAYCGKPAQHLDHVIPLSRGGSHSIGNLIQACASCNTSKNNKFIMEWRIKWS